MFAIPRVDLVNRVGRTLRTDLVNRVGYILRVDLVNYACVRAVVFVLRCPWLLRLLACGWVCVVLSVVSALVCMQ